MKDIGPKEKMLREMREGKISHKPKLADVRSKIARIKPMTKQSGRRGR